MTAEANELFPSNETNSPLYSELRALVKPELCTDIQTYNDFRERLSRGKLTRVEDSASHFGVFILLTDPKTGKVLLGFHRKAGQWIPLGGHTEPDETTLDTLHREITEESGMVLDKNDSRVKGPIFFSTVEIEDPNRTCKKHYDTWYSVEKPEDQSMTVNDEFAETKWINPEDAIRNGEVTDPSTLNALQRLIK